MRRITIEIEDGGVTACYSNGSERKASMALEGPVTWDCLWGKIKEGLQLDLCVPPGAVMQRTSADQQTWLVKDDWRPQICGFGLPGFGWGFWLPGISGSCCGFRDEAAAARAARSLMHNKDRIPTMPSAVSEVFTLDGVYAFLDLFGEIHATFITAEDAAGCAAKLENEHLQKP